MIQYMIRVLLATALLLGSLSAAAANFYRVSFYGPLPKLMTYHELASLPPYKRIAYLAEIRQILVDMEKLGKKNRSAQYDDFRDSLRELISQLEILPLAHAQATCPEGYFSNLKNFGVCARPLGRLSVGTKCRKTEHLLYKKDGDKTYKACIPTELWKTLSNQNDFSVAEKPEAANPPVSSSPAAAAEDEYQLDINAKEDELNERHKQYGDVIGCRQVLDKDKDTYTRENYRKALEEKTDEENIKRNCVMGGMFSTYAAQKIVKGKCQPMTVFPLPTSASTSNAEGVEKLECKTPGTSMCNPLLFCAEPPTKPGDLSKPFCLKIVEDLTQGCLAEMKSKGVTDCDPFADKYKIPAAQNEWVEFKANFDVLCHKENGFVKFFCQECKMMAQRVRAVYTKYGNMDKLSKDAKDWTPAPRESAPTADKPAGSTTSDK